MKKIKLFNRDGADLWLEEGKMVALDTAECKLKVDNKHTYCLEYIRLIGDFPNSIDAVDPSGGPMINVGDEFENGKYEIVKIINSTTFWISERNNNN